MDTTTTQQATTIVADLANDGGGTYETATLIPFKPEVGFAVGIGGVRYPASLFTPGVAAWLLRAVGQEYETSFVGTWLDNETVCVDAVRYFAGSNRKDALLAGYQAGQDAIYDFGMSESIYLGEEPIE